MRYEQLDPEMLYTDNFWYCAPSNFAPAIKNWMAPLDGIEIFPRTQISRGDFVDVMVIGRWLFLNPSNDDKPDETLMCIVGGAGLVAIPFITLNELREDTIRNKVLQTKHL